MFLLEAVGDRFRRKTKRERQGESIGFWIFYVGFLAFGIGLIIVSVWSIYK